MTESKAVSAVPAASVHRLHADTVFLSDTRRDGPDCVVGTAMLPDEHTFYAAHTARGNQRLDPMLVLEACRQTAMYMAHSYYDVPAGTQFLLLTASLSLSADAHRAAPETGPCELTM